MALVQRTSATCSAEQVEWLLPEGPQLYWRGRLVEVAYELAEPS